jgi:hypothetical protein
MFVQFKPEEMANIMKDFDEPGFLAPTGLFLGPTKYMVIQGEPGAVIRGKKVRTIHIHRRVDIPRPDPSLNAAVITHARMQIN